jgi:hypothetical protein
MRITTTLEKWGIPGLGGAGTVGGGGVGDRAGGVVERSGTGAGVTVLLGVVGAQVALVAAGREAPDDEDP